MTYRTAVALLVAFLALIAGPAIADEALDIGHAERAVSGQIQAPIVAAGPGDLYRLSPDDIEVWIGDRRLDEFSVDYLSERTRTITSYALPDPGAEALLYGSVINGLEQTTPAAGRAPSVSGQCGDTSVSFPAGKGAPLKSGMSGLRSGYHLVARPRWSSVTTQSRFERSVLSLVSVDAAEAPPSPLLRIVSRQKFLRLDTAGFDGPPDSTVGVHAELIPMRLDDEGKLETLVQISMPNPGQDAGTWHVGLSLLSGSMSAVVWGRVESNGDEMRLVLQDTFAIPPGGYELWVQAQNEETGVVRENRLLGALKKPRKNRLSIGPIAAFQTERATVIQAGQSASSAALVALGDDEALALEHETVPRSLVCGHGGTIDDLRVDRSLIASDAPDAPDARDARDAIELPAARLEPGDENCLVLSDRLPAGSLEPGRFRYHVRVSGPDRAGAEAERELIVGEETPTRLASR